jgi:hypothetical protein
MSSPHEQIDMALFERQVASITEQLDVLWTGSDLPKSPPLGAVSGDERKQVVEEVLNQIYEDATKGDGAALGSKDEIRAAALKARTALQTPPTRAVICRALHPVATKGSREMALEITKFCLPLAIAGQIAVPVSALVWGILGFAVATIGVVWLCGDEN